MKRSMLDQLVLERRLDANAAALAAFLETHPSVATVHYPALASHPQHELAKSQMSGFGGVLSFELRGGFESAERFVSGLRLVTRAASLGGYESLVVHPAAMWAHSMTEEELRSAGIAPGLIRFSTGLEESSDLIADFEQALG